MNQIKTEIKTIDDKLSKRPIALDPGGYFIIYLDRENNLICADYYTNIITEKGLSADPVTGKVIAARGSSVKRLRDRTFKGRTGKELCVKVIEEPSPSLITMFDHAAYIGRECMRAEYALINGEEYIQD